MIGIHDPTKIGPWKLDRDERGWFAHDPSGPSWVRVNPENGDVDVRSHDGGCNIPPFLIRRLGDLGRDNLTDERAAASIEFGIRMLLVTADWEHPTFMQLVTLANVSLWVLGSDHAAETGEEEDEDWRAMLVSMLVAEMKADERKACLDRATEYAEESRRNGLRLVEPTGEAP